MGHEPNRKIWGLGKEPGSIIDLSKEDLPSLSLHSTANISEPTTVPVEQVKSQDRDVARRRSQFFDLLRKERQLQTELDKTWFLGKAKIMSQLQLVQRDISRQRIQFPELATLTLPDSITNPAIQAAEKAYKLDQVRKLGTKDLNPEDQTKRQRLLNEIMANERADLAKTLQAKTFDTMMAELNKLLQTPPKWYQSQDQWFQQCLVLERDFDVPSQADNAMEAFRYWNKKAKVLETIRPALFNRERWQKEYQRTQNKIDTLRPLIKAKSSE